MRKRFLILLNFLIVLVLVITGCTLVQAQGEGGDTPDASKALETLKQLVTDEFYEQMGFKTLKELDSATLGAPLKEFMVGLDTLKEYEQGIDPDSMLSDTGLFIYPVLVNGETRSSISGTVKDGVFSAVSFGRPNYIKMVMLQLLRSSELEKLPTDSFFIVRIPAFNYLFLGYYSDGRLMLIPVRDIPYYDMKSGVSLPADDVFQILVPAAREHDGLPR